MRLHFVATTIAVIAIVIIAGCEQETIVVTPEAPRVSVMQPEQRELSDHEEFNGWMAADKRSRSASRVKGHIKKIHLHGRPVREKGRLAVRA